MIAFIQKEKELPLLAEAILKQFPNQKNFVLTGDLAAGKTHFVKAFAHTLGSIDSISSPTFSLVNEYVGKDNHMIYHFDLYRLESEEELIDIGFESYLDEDQFIFIEWPTLALPFLEEYIHLDLLELESGTRQITIHLKSS